MCGIAGTFSKDISDERIVEEIISSQYLRGPDNSSIVGFELNSFYGFLGHNRLSIIDTTDLSNQPLWDNEKEHVIVFNGEIYNYNELKNELLCLGYKFRTKGDSEVLLAALKIWGVLALNKLNGMFAFCFVNLKNKTGIIARDRFGKKPLYYFTSPSKFMFASTPTVMAKNISAGPNFDYLQNGLDFWIYESDSKITQYQNIYNLPGGQYIQLSFENDKIDFVIKTYYSLENNVKSKFPLFINDFSTAKDYILRLLEDSIKLRLQTDVPLAISLSGGLDSSTIASIVSRFNPNIEGITLGNPNLIKSEGPIVKRLAKYLDINVHYVHPEKKIDIIDAFEKCMEAQDSPLLGLSYLAEYMVYKKANELGFKVMLGGQGGDEVFMGYRKYHYFAFKDDLTNYRFLKAISRFITLGLIAKRDFSSLRLIIPSMMRYIDGNGLSSILKFPSNYQENLGFNNGIEDFWLRQIIDIKKISIPIQLKSEDRNSMANSIETRAPFLDYRLVENGISLPLDFKIKGGFGKYIIREMMQNRLPEEIRISKIKRGFDVTDDWIGNGLGDHIRDRLNTHRNLLKGYLKQGKSIDDFTNHYLSKKKGAFQEATTLIWISKFL